MTSLSMLSLSPFRRFRTFTTSTILPRSCRTIATKAMESRARGKRSVMSLLSLSVTHHLSFPQNVRRLSSSITDPLPIVSPGRASTNPIVNQPLPSSASPHAFPIPSTPPSPRRPHEPTTPPASPSFVVDPEPVTPRKSPPTLPPEFRKQRTRRSLPPFSNLTLSADGHEGDDDVLRISPTATSFFGGEAEPPAHDDSSFYGGRSSPTYGKDLRARHRRDTLEGQLRTLYRNPAHPLPPSPSKRPSQPTSARPYLRLVRTSSTPIHLGSAVPIALRAFNFLPSPSRLKDVVLTFSGVSTVLPADDADFDDHEREDNTGKSHLLFRFKHTVVLDGPMWVGEIVVPSLVRCETCGQEGETPWTFSHRDAGSGRSYETAYLLEAELGEEMRTSLVIDVLPRATLPPTNEWQKLDSGTSVAYEGALEDLDLRSFEVRSLASAFSSTTLTPYPVQVSNFIDTATSPTSRCTPHSDLNLLVQFSLLCHRASTHDLSRLLTLLSPEHTTVSLSAVLRDRENGTTIPLGASWTSSSTFNVQLYLKVESTSSEALRLTLRRSIQAKAIAMSRSSSCAGFTVEVRSFLSVLLRPMTLSYSLQFLLRLCIGNPDSSNDCLSIALPFRPPAAPVTPPQLLLPSPSPSAVIYLPKPRLLPPTIIADPLAASNWEVESTGCCNLWERVRRFGDAVVGCCFAV